MFFIESHLIPSRSKFLLKIFKWNIEVSILPEPTDIRIPTSKRKGDWTWTQVPVAATCITVKYRFLNLYPSYNYFSSIWLQSCLFQLFFLKIPLLFHAWTGTASRILNQTLLPKASRQLLILLDFPTICITSFCIMYGTFQTKTPFRASFPAQSTQFLHVCFLFL